MTDSIQDNPRIPQMIQPMLDTYFRLMDQCLPGFLSAFYLHGSIALGAFDPRYSDVDFIAIASRSLSIDDIASLEAVHRSLLAQFPESKLDGSYMQPSDLGKFDKDISPYPYFNQGVFEVGKHDGNAITWWVLKNKAVTLLGSNPKDLPFTVDMDELIVGMRENLNTYWKSYTRIGTRMAWLLNDQGIQWAVLGVLRQYYTFHERGITSKIEAGEYALDHLPERWHRLIREALRIRRDEGVSQYGNPVMRAVGAVRFLNDIIRRCNEMVGASTVP